MKFAYEVANLIYQEAQSGSASWDELNGPQVTWAAAEDGKWVLTLPVDYGDDGPDWDGPLCVITVQQTGSTT